MVRDIKEYDYGIVEGKTDSLKWGNNISLMCDTKEQFPYAEKCLFYLDTMPKEMENRLIQYLLRYLKDYICDFPEEEQEELSLINEENMIEHIHITSVIVDAECREEIIEFHIEGECDWEPEHGLEITISDGKILYVGPYNDYGPNSSRMRYALENYGYYNPNSDFNMNYADKE